MISFDRLSSQEADRLLATARALREAARAGQAQPLLRGKNIALLAPAQGDDADLFIAAATEMGAKVSQVGTETLGRDSPQQLEQMAHVLTRLYDAVECEGLPSALVRRLASLATVPVYDSVASASHPTARLSALLGEGSSPAEARRFVVQATLLASIS